MNESFPSECYVDNDEVEKLYTGSESDEPRAVKRRSDSRLKQMALMSTSVMAQHSVCVSIAFLSGGKRHLLSQYP